MLLERHCAYIVAKLDHLGIREKIMLVLSPAYGKDYKSKKEVMEAWDAGKDFVIENPGYPRYINKEDAEKLGVPDSKVEIRYKNKTMLVIVGVKRG